MDSILPYKSTAMKITDRISRFKIGQVYQMPNCIITREIESIDGFYINTIWRRKDKVAKRRYEFRDNPLKEEFLIRTPLEKPIQLTIF